MEVRIKRVYEPYEESDGYRVLVDRLWPRGLTKERVHYNVWEKGIAPSTELRRWFGHDPAKWDEFKKRYVAELNACCTPQGTKPITRQLSCRNGLPPTRSRLSANTSWMGRFGRSERGPAKRSRAEIHSPLGELAPPVRSVERRPVESAHLRGSYGPSLSQSRQR